jgi:hypothetical protein
MQANQRYAGFQTTGTDGHSPGSQSLSYQDCYCFNLDIDLEYVETFAEIIILV